MVVVVKIKEINMQEFMEPIIETFGEKSENWPKRITISSWLTIHESRGIPGCSDTLNEVIENASFEYNVYDCWEELTILGFDISDSDKYQGMFDGVCGGDHYELKNGQYEPIPIKMIGGVKLSDKEEITKVLKGTVGRVLGVKGPLFH